jgi:hypothetical protein
MAIEIDKSVGYHPGQLVKFFNPFKDPYEEQISEGIVTSVDHWMQTLTVGIGKAQAKEAEWFVGEHQVVKMNNPHIEVVPNEVTQISNVKAV